MHVHHWRAEPATFLVLLVHGYGEHAGRYEHVAARLTAAGGEVYGPDHAGHGRSDGERALITDAGALVDDLERVVADARAEHPDLPLAVIGHSMGGLLATLYARRHREAVDALVLSGPVIGGNPDLEALLGMDPIPEIPIDPAVLSRDPAVGEAYAADPLVYHGPFLRPTLEALFAAAGSLADAPSFGDLPLLWIHGEEDALAPLAPAREAMSRLRGPGTEEKVYPGARHEIFNEVNQDEVLDDVVGFLQRVLP